LTNRYIIKNMAYFDPEQAKIKQNATLERVQKIYKTLQAEVVDYYWDRAPQSQEEAFENERGIHSYLKTAYADLDALLTEEDRDLG
jgi:hypothetical protein